MLLMILFDKFFIIRAKNLKVQKENDLFKNYLKVFKYRGKKLIGEN